MDLPLLLLPAASDGCCFNLVAAADSLTANRRGFNGGGAPGKAKILDDLREVVALHRDRYVFPIKILVTKSQGSGADAIFMGLLKVD